MSACEPRIWPIGAASGGEPDLAADLRELLETSSSRSPAACARRLASIPATSPAGSRYSAARTATRGASGVDRLVADVLVDDLRRLPERGDVDAGVETEAVERLRERLAGDAVHREGDGVDRARCEVGADAHRLERRGHRVAAGSLAVDADRQAARLADALDELGCSVRPERTGGVVDDDPRRAELGELARLLDERVHLACDAGAVDEPGLELTLGRGDRLGRLAEVRDVVQRVVQAEDVDPVLGRRRDEPPGELAVDRPGADEEAPAQREPERGLDARLDRPDPLPRALHAPPDRAVEDAAAGDLEVGEPRSVEDLGEPEQLGRPHRSRERVLPEQANRRVDELRHARDLIAAVKRARPRSTAGGPSSCPRAVAHAPTRPR